MSNILDHQLIMRKRHNIIKAFGPGPWPSMHHEQQTQIMPPSMHSTPKPLPTMSTVSATNFVIFPRRPEHNNPSPSRKRMFSGIDGPGNIADSEGENKIRVLTFHVSSGNLRRKMERADEKANAIGVNGFVRSAWRTIGI